MLGVSFYGPIFMIQNVAPKMPQGGRIINIGSISSKMGSSTAPLYSAVKGAMDTLSFAAAMEVGQQTAIPLFRQSFLTSLISWAEAMGSRLIRSCRP
jgi:NAD(P)-dependent dehydrogenase (short-subunit alcohol dehydrogenase family)